MSAIRLLAVLALGSMLSAQTTPPTGPSPAEGLSSPAAQTTGSGGVVVGTVFDATTGQPVRGAAVHVEGQPGKTATTSSDGSYRLDLAPGKYKLRFVAENYAESTVDEVIVSAAEPVEASTVMANKGSVTTIDVVEKVDAITATAEAALAERRLAPVVSDAITSEEIGKSTASDAAAALQKVTGVSVVGDGYVYVRGLGERYSATMLNNAMITTTEPEKRVVPLDLFPASLIQNVKILKTYTPDLPGEFSGGLVQLTTVEFPSQKLLKVGFGVGVNSQTTFERFSNYRGGGTGDFFGFGKDDRALPGIIPRDRTIVAGRFTPTELQQFGQAFDTNWEPEPVASMRPSVSYNIVGGNTFGKLGIVGALSFSNDPQFTPEFQQYNRVGANNQAIPFNIYPDYQSNMQQARMGAVLNLAYRFTPTQKIALRNTLTNDADKEFRRFSGYNNDLGTDIVNERLRYIQRSLISTQLEGEHVFEKFGGSILNWQLGYSRATRDEPDLREVTRAVDDGIAFYTNTNESGLRFFNDLEDRIYEPGVSVAKPFYSGKLSGMFKVGFRGTFRDREFSARRFRFFPVQLSTINRTLPSNLLFGPQNIRPNGFELREDTRLTDAYIADMTVYGGFAMVDMAIGPKWRFVGGLRMEWADQRVVTIDPLTTSGTPIIANLYNRDLLPSANLIYALTRKQNLRVGYSRTVSRPDFRELSPFEFTNVAGGFTAIGNPNLLRATIDNFDGRWEYFPTGDQLIALSYFYKRFKNPIESTIEPTNALRQSFLNADRADNQGIEAEFRRNLRFVTPHLRDFTLGSNFTFVDSSVTIPQSQRNTLTTLNRPLVGQSRYIFNGHVEWLKPRLRSSARFFANYVSSRITDVGAFGLPDIVQQPVLMLDAVYQINLSEDGRWSMRFGAENLADNEYRFTQGSQPYRIYRLGRTFTVGTGFTIF